MNKLMKIFTNMLIFVCAGTVANASVEEVYSGVYKKEFQLIPNTMATLCKISADDVVQDVQKLKDCINKLALKRRSSDAELSREGLKDLNQIKADELQEMIALSAAKGAAVTGYFAITSKEANEVNTEADTVSDVDASAINSTKVLTSVVNSLRDLYVEQLKNLAIADIENIERDALMEVASLDTIRQAEKEAAENNGSEGNSGSSGSGSGSSGSGSDSGNGGNSGGSSQPVVPNDNTADEMSTEFRVVDGVCSRCTKKGDTFECRQEICPDGEYPDANNANIMYVCTGGHCEKVDLKDELKTVSADVYQIEGHYEEKGADGKPYKYCSYCRHTSFGDRCDIGNCPGWIKPYISETEKVVTFECSNGVCQ